MHCRVFSKLPGLYPIDASDTPTPTQRDNQKNISRHWHRSPGGKTTPGYQQELHSQVLKSKHCHVFTSLEVPTATRVRGGNYTLWKWKDTDSIWILPLFDCVTLGKLPHLSVPPFLLCKVEIIIIIVTMAWALV